MAGGVRIELWVQLLHDAVDPPWADAEAGGHDTCWFSGYNTASQLTVTINMNVGSLTVRCAVYGPLHSGEPVVVCAQAAPAISTGLQHLGPGLTVGAFHEGE